MNTPLLTLLMYPQAILNTIKEDSDWVLDPRMQIKSMLGKTPKATGNSVTVEFNLICKHVHIDRKGHHQLFHACLQSNDIVSPYFTSTPDRWHAPISWSQTVRSHVIIHLPSTNTKTIHLDLGSCFMTILKFFSNGSRRWCPKSFPAEVYGGLSFQRKISKENPQINFSFVRLSSFFTDWDAMTGATLGQSTAILKKELNANNGIEPRYWKVRFSKKWEKTPPLLRILNWSLYYGTQSCPNMRLTSRVTVRPF